MSNFQMTAVLLTNLGTPEAPTAAALRPYLNEFLGDPRVLDMPAPLRALLLHGIILNTRPPKSAEAYAKIWTENGSPLMVYTRALGALLSKNLGETYHVEIGMRYGNPSLEHALDRLLSHGPERLLVVPLYPQYASATVGSTVERIFDLLKTRQAIPSLRILDPFYASTEFHSAYAQNSSEDLKTFNPDKVLFSYHGLPERQILKVEGAKGHCLAADDSCCSAITARNAQCYRAQCFATTRQLVTALDISENKAITSFQSRLGRIPWIRPYTEDVLAELPKQGFKRLAVFTPAFATDCLETIEEIGMRGKEAFLAAGGESFRLFPCLNATPAWGIGLSNLIRRLN